MTKAAAWHNFWSAFGIPAYEENSVPDGEDDPGFPRLTYQFGTDSFSDYSMSLTVSIWYRDPSWVSINAKAEEIGAMIGREYGDSVPCDGGYFRVKRGSPWALRMGGEGSGLTTVNLNDDYIRRIVFNVEVAWYTFS